MQCQHFACCEHQRSYFSIFDWCRCDNLFWYSVRPSQETQVTMGRWTWTRENIQSLKQENWVMNVAHFHFMKIHHVFSFHQYINHNHDIMSYFSSNSIMRSWFVIVDLVHEIMNQRIQNHELNHLCNRASSLKIFLESRPIALETESHLTSG